MHLNLSRRAMALLALIILAVAVPLTIYLVRQQQDIRQRAAGESDLVITGFQLVDAGGNVRTTFGVNEEIYVRARIKNDSGSIADPAGGSTFTLVYQNRNTPIPLHDGNGAVVTIRTGQFAPGQEATMGSWYGGPQEGVFDGRSWHMPNPGTYTASIVVNFNELVSESTQSNNQATISYQVTNNFIGDNIYRDGQVLTSAPAGFSNLVCNQPGTINGVTGCVLAGSLNGRSVVRLTNNSGSTRTAGAATYQAYYDYPSSEPTCSPAQCPRQYDWIWTQTIYAAKTTTINSGQTVYISLPAPSCNWQTDAFSGGNIFLSFLPPDQFYGGQGTLLGGGWLEQNSTNTCAPDQPPFPSPTPTPPPNATPTPSPTVTPIPSITPTIIPSLTPTGTLTPSPSPTRTPTPSPSVCPVPTQVTNVRIECPFCGQ